MLSVALPLVGREDSDQPTVNRQATTYKSGKKGSHACIVTENVRPWPAFESW